MSEPKHYLFVANALFGHLRPMLALALTILPLNPHLHLTILIPSSAAKLAEQELDNYVVDPSALARLELQYHGKAEGRALPLQAEMLTLIGEAENGVRSALPDIIKAPKCGVPVSAIIYDYVFYTLAPIFREAYQAAQKDMPKLVFYSAVNPAYFDWFVLVTTPGAPVDRVYKDIEQGRNPLETWQEHLETDEMEHVPGCHPMFARETIGNVSMEGLMPAMADARKICVPMNDAFLYVSSPCLGQDSVPLWNQPGKPLYQVGPLLPPRKAVTDGGEDDVNRFLDQCASNHGERSVALVSFGSLNFGPSDEMASVIVDALAARNRPALFTMGNIPPEQEEHLRKAVEAAAGLIKLVKWVDQARVLQHPAMRWMLGHAGQGGVHESISAEIPCVYWPVSWDQPFLANQLAEVEKVGIELVQSRTGASVGHQTARGVKVEGTPEALRAELDEAIRRMESEGINTFRTGLQRIKGEWAKDAQEGGRQYVALRAVADL